MFYREGITLVKASHSVEVLSTSDIDPELLRDIIKIECGE
jgi:hypothetical protein